MSLWSSTTLTQLRLTNPGKLPLAKRISCPYSSASSTPSNGLPFSQKDHQAPRPFGYDRNQNVKDQKVVLTHLDCTPQKSLLSDFADFGLSFKHIPKHFVSAKNLMKLLLKHEEGS